MHAAFTLTIKCNEINGRTCYCMYCSWINDNHNYIFWNIVYVAVCEDFCISSASYFTNALPYGLKIENKNWKKKKKNDKIAVAFFSQSGSA